MVTVTQETYARGVNFVFAREYIIKTYGENIWNTLLETIPPAFAKQWKGAILPASSYSFESFKSLTQTLSKSVGASSQIETSKMYGFIAESSLNSLYKVFFKFTSPAFVLKNYSKLWTRFFNAGTVNIISSETGHAVIEFLVPETFVDWLDDACYGYSKKAIELSGGRNLKLSLIKISNLGNDQWSIKYDLSWTE